jgi:hypothetical protein
MAMISVPLKEHGVSIILVKTTQGGALSSDSALQRDKPKNLSLRKQHKELFSKEGKSLDDPSTYYEWNT